MFLYFLWKSAQNDKLGHLVGYLNGIKFWLAIPVHFRFLILQSQTHGLDCWFQWSNANHIAFLITTSQDSKCILQQQASLLWGWGHEVNNPDSSASYSLPDSLCGVPLCCFPTGCSHHDYTATQDPRLRLRSSRTLESGRLHASSSMNMRYTAKLPL